MPPAAPESASPAGDAPDRSKLLARLDAAGFTFKRAESVVADFANDPPLSRSAAVTAREEAARIVDGVGAAMVAAKARRGVIAVRDAAAHKALSASLSARGATTVRAVLVPDVWPSTGLDRDLGCDYALSLDGERLLDLESAAFARPRALRRVTVAGFVHAPRVIALETPLTVEELVILAGGSTAPADAWVALDGGPWNGRLIDRDAPLASQLLLVLPADHPLIARARVSTSDQLRRAASACEGCRACTDVCPPFLEGRALHPHAIVAALALGSDPESHSAAASACIGCGLCTAACPSALAPAALVTAVKSRLPASLPDIPRGEPHPDRPGRRMSPALLLLRAGLQPIES